MIDKIYTTYFANKSILNDRYQVVNIATSAPVWFSGHYIHFVECKPHSHTVGIWYRSMKDDYAKRDYIYEYYKTTLSKLSPEEWEKTLFSLIKEIHQNVGYDKIAVLSCYEKPQTFCHRLVFSIFIKLILGLEIGELGFPDIFKCEEALFIENILTTILTNDNYGKYNKNKEN